MTEKQLAASRAYRERTKKLCPECGDTMILRVSTVCRECRAPAQRFLRQAATSATDECIEWPFSRLRGAYGRIGSGRGSEVVLAHRLVYESVHGRIPEGAWVLHRCDNPPCCNPRHLFLGDHQANVDDMIQKGRNCRGSRSKIAKLTEDQAIEIRHRYSQGGVSQRQLAEEYGVHQGTISPLILRRTWAHV